MKNHEIKNNSRWRWRTSPRSSLYIWIFDAAHPVEPDESPFWFNLQPRPPRRFFHPCTQGGGEHGHQGGEDAPPHLPKQCANSHHRQTFLARGILSKPFPWIWVCLATWSNNLCGPVCSVQHLSLQWLLIDERLLHHLQAANSIQHLYLFCLYSFLKRSRHVGDVR